MQKETIKYPQGMKWTKQRKQVYDVLYEANEPLSALQIYHNLTNNYAVSTIYRILTVFEEKNMVTKASRLDGNTFVYEINRGEHTHYAVCLSCHKHILLHSCPFEHVHLSQAEEDFQITGHKLELYGYCRDCQKSSK